MNRPTIHQTMMEVAKVMAGRSTCSGRAVVGAVLTLDDRIIATGYNGSASGVQHCDADMPSVHCEMIDGHCKTAIHAEENAILQCALLGRSCKGATLYVTHSPCKYCAYRIIQAGIARVVYSCKYRVASEGIDVLFNANIPSFYLTDAGYLTVGEMHE